MTDLSESTTAGANGTAHVQFSPIAAGLMWVVPQFSIEVIPFTPGAACTIRRNGRFISSTALGSGDTAFGPPSIILNRGDVLSFDWAGMTPGSEAVATLFYSEQTWAATPNEVTAI